MSIDLTCEVKGRYVLATCEGVYRGVDLLDAFDRALGFAVGAGLADAVVDIRDVRLDGPPPGTMERYYVGETAAKIQREHETLVVFAVVGKEPLLDPERFAETVARNRGARGKVFDDMGAAIRWVENRAVDSPGAS